VQESKGVDIYTSENVAYDVNGQFALCYEDDLYLAGTIFISASRSYFREPILFPELN
jgi:hypothetical protein